MHYQTAHLIHGQMMSVFQMTAFRFPFFMYNTAPADNTLKYLQICDILAAIQSEGVNWPSSEPLHSGCVLA